MFWLVGGGFEPNTHPERLCSWKSFSEVYMLSRTSSNTSPNFPDTRTEPSWISVKQHEEREKYFFPIVFFP